MGNDQLWQNIDAERRHLRDLLAGLDPEQWEQPSLCAGWRVQEVAAHVLSSPSTPPAQAALALLRAGGNFNKMIDTTARAAAAAAPAEIVAGYDRYAGSRRHPPGTTVADPLCDVIVHTQDIARPLGIEYRPAPEAVALGLSRARQVAILFGTRAVARGYRLEATDADWAAGSGDLLRAPALELMLLLTGRLSVPEVRALS